MATGQSYIEDDSLLTERKRRMGDWNKILLAVAMVAITLIFLAVILASQDSFPSLRLSTEKAVETRSEQEVTRSELARRYVVNEPDAWHAKLDLSKEEMDSLAEKLISIEKAGWQINKVRFLSKSEVYSTFSDNDLDAVDFALNDSNYAKVAIIRLDARPLNQDEATLKLLPENTMIVLCERTGSNEPVWNDMWFVKLK